MSVPQLLDSAPSETQFLRDCLEGLSKRQKSLPCKYLYDRRGSKLFDRICHAEEYYPTRTELAIMREHVGEMVEALGRKCLLVEYGSGSSLKTQILLDHLSDPAGYVPVDISRKHLAAAAESLRERYPHLTVTPVCADFTQPFSLPVSPPAEGRTVAYFPGSTIGNFAPEKAAELLRNIAETIGEGGGLLMGADRPKRREILEAAYDDAAGVTREFNLNVLRRINRELGADFDLDAFEHRSVYNEEEGRVEMHLVSQVAQTVHLAGREISFEAGESIHTENSYKYDPNEFRGLVRSAGFSQEQVWLDPNEFFGVHFFSR